VGFEAVLPVTGASTVYARLCQVTGDNLAFNGMLGFVLGIFFGDHFCTIYYATKENIQTIFRAEYFQRRTIKEYDRDLSKIPAAQKMVKNHSRGVKTNCLFNKIDAYHVTENWSLDIMHIVLEGIIPVEIGCVLYGLCVDKTLLDLGRVNCELNTFWGQLTVSKNDKPPAFNQLLELGMGITPSMKAIQYWSLLKKLTLEVSFASFVMWLISYMHLASRKQM